MNAKRFSLDTNILFYAMDRDAGHRHKAAVDIVHQASVTDCVMVLQVLGEFYAAVTGKNRMPASEAEAQILDWMKLFPVVSATSKSLKRALPAVNQYRMSFWDALLWATACEASVTVLITEDFQHDRVIEGVRFCNPFLIDDPMDALFSS
jgi:predicted nucleic acid-binding protein